MSFDREQFQDLIERVLDWIGLQSEAAVNLLMGTAAQESAFGTYLRQVGGGPALGVFQMEPRTEVDIWLNYLQYRDKMAASVRGIAGYFEMGGISSRLEWNLAYQIAMARIQYRRIKAPLPDPDDIEGLARYWKEQYNTPKGSGAVKDIV